jgi:site-specific recombinase XerD
MSSQLFHDLPTITLPVSGVKLKDGNHITSETIPAFPFMYWPSGNPCLPVNMYFLDIAHETTGGSLRTYATQLSHLVRYCGEKPVSIESLTDAHIHELSTQLQKEKSRHHPLERTRNDNTVNDTLSRVFRFLFWYQKKFMLLLHTPLIGEQDDSPQITVKRISNGGTRSKNHRIEYYYTHPAMPTSESREPKRPISLSVIEDIERIINKQSMLKELNARFVQRYRNNVNLLSAQLEYMRARRLFMIWMMKRTGLRPSELVGMSVDEHIKILTTRALKIPTMKKRKVIAPKRSFPIPLNAAAVVHRYLNARTAYCEAIQSAGKAPHPSNAFFLTEDGEPIKKSSLEKDFERLAAKAGYKDVQTCLSMFRHRFITYEVIAHLKEFIDMSGKSRQMMTDIDYESILKRVAVKTGQNPQSLWHYIDLAWEELGVWGAIDNATARLHAADQLYSDLLNLQHETEIMNSRQANRKINLKWIVDRLSEILTIGKQDIDFQELHGKLRTFPESTR